MGISMGIGRSALGVALVCVVGVGLVASPTRAQDAGGDAAARAHFEAGRLHFDRGAYEEAQREFEAAYELSQRAALLYNLYLTAERLGQLDDAIGYLERYLVEGSPDDEQRALLSPRLENMRERRARSAPTQPAAEPEPEPAAAAPVITARREGDIVPAAVAFGVAGAALVSFAIFGGLALAEDGSLAEGCGAARSCTDDQVSTLSTYNIVADVSWVTAAVATAAGVVLLVTLGLPSEDEPADASAFLAPWATPDGSGGIAIAGRF